MERYICLHGHFYQPPRENPWLEAIELQDSAYPYHDWNERITAECYAPNGASRMLDHEHRIEKIVNNYSRISFNFGPTLLSWMEARAPRAYQAILEADRESREHFSGHGAALAQVYNHMILPLANRRDKETQVIWGIRDFEQRFGRKPEGMWLSETAADLESLEVLAGQGIRFTILAPGQARRVRPIGGRWRDVSGARVDPSMPYLVKLPSGGTIVVFFYDGPISRGVAFEGLLANGERFANRLTGAFSSTRNWPQLVHIATDGESYGHHHRYGDMALATAIHSIERNESAHLTIYGEYLERHEPTHQAEIFERSSWSCVHGVDRWWSDCGCNSGGHSDWNQAWRTPLRQALDWLRDELAPGFEERARDLLGDPWAARDDYIAVIRDRSPASQQRFWTRHAARELSDEEQVTARKLLELQRHAMLMYTSCGWFFDDISGIETVQVIQYAGRVIQLAREVLGNDPEPGFLEGMAEAKSNVPGQRDGARIYEKSVRMPIRSRPAGIASWSDAHSSPQRSPASQPS
jgi:alpha-amylase/alpha-mannosidase (GH57 family)